MHHATNRMRGNLHSAKGVVLETDHAAPRMLCFAAQTRAPTHLAPHRPYTPYATLEPPAFTDCITAFEPIHN